MIEFIGLKAKMYALRVDGKKDTKKAKEFKSNVIARSITFDDYMQCLNNKIEMKFLVRGHAGIDRTLCVRLHVRKIG